MRLQNMPTLDEVRSLPRYLTQRVPESFLDQNGHMNIQHYLGLYDAAGMAFFTDLGVDETYFTDRRLGFFDLEHHLWYLAECHRDDDVAVYSRLVARTEKRLHGVWFLVNETREQLSNIFEFVTSHADLESRRTAAFPEDVAGRLDALIARDRALSWTVPTSGIIRP